MRLATGISNMLPLKSRLYSTMCFHFCIWQNYSVNNRGKKVYTSTYVKLEPGDIRCTPGHSLNCELFLIECSVLSVVWRPEFRQKPVSPKLRCHFYTTEQGVWRELANGLRTSKAHMGGCTSERWGSTQGWALGLLQKWLIGWREKSLHIKGAAEGRHHWTKTGG